VSCVPPWDTLGVHARKAIVYFMLSS